MYVRCEKHGLVYDDITACPSCQREGAGGRAAAAPEPERKKPIGTVVLALLVVLGGAAGVYFLRKHAAEQAARDAARARAEQAAAVLAPRVPPSAEVALIRRSRPLAATLDQILRANRGTILGFAEGPVDTAAADRREARRAKQYVTYAQRLEQQFTRAAGDGPASWGARSEEVQAVEHYLAAVIGALRQAAPSDHVPPRAERQRVLDAARGYLAAAHTALSNLPR